MSKFNSYAKRLDAAYKKAREEYLELYNEQKSANAALKAANEWRKETYEGENNYRQTKAKLRVQEADRAMALNRSAIWDKYRAERDAIAEELRADSHRSDRVSPDDVDPNGLKLLESGVMDAADYAAFLERYDDNPTMLRLLAKYAHDASETTTNYKDRSLLLAVAQNAQSGEPAIMRRWGEITESMEYCTVSPKFARPDETIAIMCGKYEEIFDSAISEF